MARSFIKQAITFSPLKIKISGPTTRNTVNREKETKVNLSVSFKLNRTIIQ